ncbi:threonyl-tRNA synthetase [Savitreella phatthalungensis]
MQFIKPAELSRRMGSVRPPKVIDGSWSMPNSPRDAAKEYRNLRIRGARFFDVEHVKDQASPFPHMLPTPEHFAESMSALGIQRSDDIVVYDASSPTIFSAPRVAWTFLALSHTGSVAVLDGGLAAWVNQGFPTESDEPAVVEKSSYGTASLDSNQAVEFDELLQILAHKSKAQSDVQILDARPQPRFDGTAPEPRPGISSGHMPGAKSTPFGLFLRNSQRQTQSGETSAADTDTDSLKSSEEIKQILRDRGIDLNKRTIVSCGSGVTAVLVKCALERAGADPSLVRVYDESWSGYADPSRAGNLDGMIVKTG